MSAVYQTITDKILDALAAGVTPWRIPWSSFDSSPKNLLSKSPYRGINSFLTNLEIHLRGYRSHFFLTFKQAAQLGGTVKRGERGLPIVFWGKRDVENDEGEIETKWVARGYTVFNVEQCHGLEVEDQSEAETYQHDPIDRAEEVVAGVPHPPVIRSGYWSACYIPSSDEIRLPDLHRFPRAEDYYATIFHELGHCTGHEKRLSRETLTDLCPFGSTNYSKEELVAEMTAAFLCGHTGIIDSTIDNNAAYLDGWIKKIKGEPRLVIEAAGAAQRAADYLLNKRSVEGVTTETFVGLEAT